MTDQIHSVHADHLRQLIEQYEALAAEKADIAEAMKEKLADAKGHGYDAAIIRRIVAMRKRSPDDIAEEESILDLYLSALGMA